MLTFVQRLAHGNATNANPSTITLTASPTPGNMVILGAKSAGSVALTAVTDSKGNTWSIDKVSSTTNGGRSFIARTMMGAGTLVSGDTISLTWGSAPVSTAAAAMEYTGQAVSPVDKTALASGGGVTTLTTGSTGTLAQADEIAISVLGVGTGQTSITIPAGWTERDTGEKNAGSNNSVAMAELAVSATTALTAQWSWGTSGNAGVVLVTYKALSGAGGSKKGAFFPFFGQIRR